MGTSDGGKVGEIVKSSTLQPDCQAPVHFSSDVALELAGAHVFSPPSSRAVTPPPPSLPMNGDKTTDG